jgi:hypothetical protein
MKLQRAVYLTLTFGIVVLAQAVFNVPLALAQAPSVPVRVTNTSLPVQVQGTATVSGSVSATQTGAWNVGITGNTLNTPLFVTDVFRSPSNLINDGQHFDVQPNPNVALELPVPFGAVLTDVTLTLLKPSQPLVIVDAGGGNNNKIYVWQRVGSANSIGAPSNDGQFSMHLQSGIQNTNNGLRVAITCPGYDGNGCEGVIMWSGYQP